MVGLTDQLEPLEAGEAAQVEVDTECVVVAVLEDRRRLLELFGTSDPATATGEYRRQELPGRRSSSTTRTFGSRSGGCVKGGCLGHAGHYRKPAANPTRPGPQRLSNY